MQMLQTSTGLFKPSAPVSWNVHTSSGRRGQQWWCHSVYDEAPVVRVWTRAC